MPPVKLHFVISFTSEDPKYKVENLLHGNGSWLCSPNEQISSIKAEFQLEKATTIDFIDIGNHNSAMVCIDVGMSSWPSSQGFVSLLPTLVLMSPSDCRNGLNAKTVRMFKKEQLIQENVSKKWDRIRVTCSQPFRKGSQFGLAFLKLHSNKEKKEANIILDVEEVKKRREAMLSFLIPKVSSPVAMSESLQYLENGRMIAEELNSAKEVSHFTKKFSSPISRAAKLVMAHKCVQSEADSKQQKKELECEALTFMIAMNLTDKDIHSLKVSHIREQFEFQRNKTLNMREKLIFKNIALDYATERLNRMEKEKNASPIRLSSDEEENKTPLKTNTLSHVATHSRFPSPPDELGDSQTPSAPRNQIALLDSVVTTPTSAGRKKRTLSLVDEQPNSTETPSWNRRKDLKKCSKRERNHSSVDVSPKPCFDLGEDPVGIGESGGGLSEKCKKSEASKLHTLNLIECPLCTDLFTASSIEEHASCCDGYSADVTPSPSKARSERASNMGRLEKCPVCDDSVEGSELKDHAEACAQRRFS